MANHLFPVSFRGFGRRGGSGVVMGLLVSVMYLQPCAAELILNGTFENSATPPSSSGDHPSDWTTITNSYGQWNGIGAQDGSWFLHVGAGFGDGGRYQDVTVVDGQPYRLTFYAAGFPGEAALQSGRVQVGTAGSDANDLLRNNNAEYVDELLSDIPLSWKSYSYEFTPNASGPLRVSFQNVSISGGAGSRSAINIDSVSLVPTAPPEPTGTHPFISEFVAIGNTNREDEDGDTPDWIEIYNPTGANIDLAGYHLTDDSADLDKWTFPSTVLQTARHLVVYASDKNRAVAGGELHTNFKLSSAGEYLALVEPDGVTVVSEFAPSFPQQIAGFSYGVGGPSPDAPVGYFSQPSPGTGNGNPLPTFLVAPNLSPNCGTFTTNVAVSITQNIEYPGGEIRYTTDGSVPTVTSTLYNGTPVNIGSTTYLRARVFDPGTGGGGAIASGSYQKLSTSSDLSGIEAPAGFSSNLPIMVVENFGAGGIPAPGATLQTARISVFEVDPTTGRSSLGNSPDACFRIGIRRRGQTSASFAKAQYRVELRDDNDEDLDVPLLGLPSEADWVFNGPWTDKALIRNSLVFDLGREIGMEAPRTKHFEMFLSTDGGTLESSEYVGVYVLMEKIERGKDRVDVEKMGTSDNASPEVTGGYVFRGETKDIVTGPTATGWDNIEILDPDSPTTQQRDYLGQYLDDFAATLNWARGDGANDTGIPDNDPVTGYPAYIDVDSFVNLLAINELTREQDSYVRSDYMFKDRLGKLNKGPLWDYNLCMKTGGAWGNTNTSGWQYAHPFNRGGWTSQWHDWEPDWFVPLLREPDFRQKWIDRWTELRRSGPLETVALFERIDAHANPLAEAAVRNFTKWDNLGASSLGFSTPVSSTWEEQIVIMKDWLDDRTTWIDSQFPGTVSFTPGSSAVSMGTEVALGASGGTVYYTLDGSDPRAPGGGISSNAIPLGAGGTITIDASTDVTARLFAGSDWSAPSRATFVVGTPASASNLAVTELNYHPSDPTAAEVSADPTFRDDDFEFIEVKNISAGPIDLSGMAFVDGIDFRVPAGSVLQPGAYGLFVENQAAFEERYGSGFPITGVYANKLSNDGEMVQLVDLEGNDIARFTYNDVWYRPTDGEGYTLVPVNEDDVTADRSDPASWGISCEILGTPGAANGSALSYVFYGWLNYHFSATERADPLISGILADVDGDGIPTLLEFALGLDPRQADLSGLPGVGAVNDGGADYLSLTFRRQTKAIGLTYHVEASTDLIHWTEVTATMGSPIDNGDGTESVTIRDSQPLDHSLRRFLRLRVVETSAP